MVEKKDIRVSLEDKNTIIIEAKLRKGYFPSFKNNNEFNFFKKSITLPGKIDFKKIKAKFENGRLRIIIPRISTKIKIKLD